jgi:hypothetical protein
MVPLSTDHGKRTLNVVQVVGIHKRPPGEEWPWGVEVADNNPYYILTDDAGRDALVVGSEGNLVEVESSDTLSWISRDAVSELGEEEDSVRGLRKWAKLFQGRRIFISQDSWDRLNA